MFSYEIFEIDSITKVDLLDLLFKKSDWYPIEELVYDSQLDRKTILKYIKELSSDIATSFGSNSSTQIIFFKGKGFKFLGDAVAYHAIIRTIFEESLSLSLMKELFFQQSFSLDSFLRTHFVSESTLRRKITHFNKALKKYDLKIKTSNREIKVEGSELQFRYLSYMIFWEVYKGAFWPFPRIDEHKILQFITDEINPLSTFQELSTIQWSYMIAIILSRFNQGNAMKETELPDFAHATNLALFDTTSVFDSIVNKLKQTFHLSVPEIDFVFLLFQIRDRFYLIPNVFNETLHIHESFNTQVYQLYKLFFKLFQPDLSALDQKRVLIFKSMILVTFLSDIIFPNFSTTMTRADSSKYWRENFPFLQNTMREKLYVMKQQTSPSFLNNEKMIVGRFCEASFIIGDSSNFSPPVYIRVQEDFPIVIETIIANVLSPFCNVKFVSEFDKQIDLIVAPTASNTLKKSLSSIPIVYITTEIQIPDINNLVTAVQQIVNSKVL